MVLLSFYMVEPRIGKPWRRFHLLSIDHYPSDWLELKQLLQEIMEIIHLEHDKTEAYISVERHLPGTFTVRRTSRYRQEKVPFKREAEGFFRVEFNPKKREIYVREASFAYHLSRLRDDFRYYERGREYELPPLIPKEHQNLNDPRSLLMDPSATRYADYSRKPTEIYAFNDDEKRAYGYAGGVLPQYGKRLLNRLREKLSEPL